MLHLGSSKTQFYSDFLEFMKLWGEQLAQKKNYAFLIICFQSLDRRKYAAGAFDRAHSVGALNFGYNTDDGILRGSVAPFMHFAGNAPASESKQSLGQFSDHIDKYRDVAL